jgi:transposase-like protein
MPKAYPREFKQGAVALARQDDRRSAQIAPWLHHSREPGTLPTAARDGCSTPRVEAISRYAAIASSRATLRRQHAAQRAV